MSTDVEEQGGDGSVVGDMDHAQVVRQVALSGAHEEQPFLETKNMQHSGGERKTSQWVLTVSGVK